jgi:hypothetical protein
LMCYKSQQVDVSNKGLDESWIGTMTLLMTLFINLSYRVVDPYSAHRLCKHVFVKWHYIFWTLLFIHLSSLLVDVEDHVLGATF